MFVDEARITVKAGDGGQGCESFYRDKYMKYPRPNGGDGGKGGDVIFVAHRGVQTLLDFRFKQHYNAPKGENASSNNKRGAEGKNLVIRVPIGTIIRDEANCLLIKDMTEHDLSVIVAKGGAGGRGNNNNRIPHPPGKGEERVLHLELKLIADVGLIGFPNAGKSTIISNVSKVKSKIANYPFTTKAPILGIVETVDFTFAMADLPGIIEGAHEGRGLGDRFLKHAERTQILAHVLDMGGSEGRDPLDDYKILNHEIESYGDELMVKTRLVVANKMDLPDAEKNLKRFKRKYKVKIFPVSALEKEGLDELVAELCAMVKKVKLAEKDKS